MVHDVSSKQINFLIGSAIKKNEKHIIGNLNINAANIALENSLFQSFQEKCSLIFCDGKGIQLGAFLTGQDVPPHVTYHTWMFELLEYCNKMKYSLFFLGSKPGIGEKAISNINLKYPNLSIKCHHGYFNKEGKENSNVIKKINSFRPNILIVGFGMPLQEQWILSNMHSLEVNIFLNGGAYLEWISGNQKQSPKWMTKFGLEWFYRFLKEPKRLFRRYIIGNPLFIYRLFKMHYFKK